MESEMLYWISSLYYAKLHNYKMDIGLYKSQNLYSSNKYYKHLVNTFERSYKDMCFLVDKLLDLAILVEKEEKNK